MKKTIQEFCVGFVVAVLAFASALEARGGCERVPGCDADGEIELIATADASCGFYQVNCN